MLWKQELAGQAPSQMLVLDVSTLDPDVSSGPLQTILGALTSQGCEGRITGPEATITALKTNMPLAGFAHTPFSPNLAGRLAGPAHMGATS